MLYFRCNFSDQRTVNYYRVFNFAYLLPKAHPSFFPGQSQYKTFTIHTIVSHRVTEGKALWDFTES